ncbi:MAG TPA: flagellar hook-basal body complex protein [Pirellulales bacterium]|jgi:flagellar hook protein FlgE
MGLASALSTALTGLNAAETTIDVVGNNLANSSTVGFKASHAEFATQFLQTESLGSKPDDPPKPGQPVTQFLGGTNPRQIGLGVQVASITPDFSQGTIQLSNNPSDLAIQGDGFFIVKASNGQDLYTRNGQFQLNANNQLVTATGNDLMGYGVDKNFKIDKTSQIPLSISNSTAVAQATQNVFFQGSLTPTGDVADTAEILDSAILSDGKFDAPPDTEAVGLAPTPDASALSGAAAGAGSVLNGSYSYKITFVDASGNETLGDTKTVTVGGATGIDLSNIPVDGSTPAGRYVARNIYRSAELSTLPAGATPTYSLVHTINDNTTTTYTDTTPDSGLPTAVPADTGLTGNYTYQITWSAPGVTQDSRPSGPLPTINITDGRVVLSNLAAPSGAYVGGTINIYRNVAGQPDTFYKVASGIQPGNSYTDSMSDADAITANDVLDPSGPTIQTSTLLTDVLTRDGSTFTHVFKEGTLSFTPDKGGRQLGTKTLTIDNTTTVDNLITFMTQAMGIQPPGADAHTPIPNSLAVGDPTGKPPGGLVLSDGRIELVGNNGVDNAISVPLSSFKLTPSDGSPVTAPNLGFSSTQTAKGQSAAADFIVYDSLGIPLNVRVTSVLESRDSTGTTYRWFADSPGNDPATGASIAVGTGQIKFDGEGNLLSITNSTVSIQRHSEPSDSPLEFNLDFSQVSGLASDSSSLSASRQDGSAPGTLTSYIIGEDGTIKGVFSNGISRDLGQIALAHFSNPDGLQAVGDNNYAAGVNSGLAQVDVPGKSGLGAITAGAVELSNTDIGKNLIDLILASTAYRGNTRVITTVDQMLQELLSLNR